MTHICRIDTSCCQIACRKADTCERQLMAAGLRPLVYPFAGDSMSAAERISVTHFFADFRKRLG